MAKVARVGGFYQRRRSPSLSNVFFLQLLAHVRLIKRDGRPFITDARSRFRYSNVTFFDFFSSIEKCRLTTSTFFDDDGDADVNEKHLHPKTDNICQTNQNRNKMKLLGKIELMSFIHNIDSKKKWACSDSWFLRPKKLVQFGLLSFPGSVAQLLGCRRISYPHEVSSVK